MSRSRDVQVLAGFSGKYKGQGQGHRSTLLTLMSADKTTEQNCRLNLCYTILNFVYGEHPFLKKSLKGSVQSWFSPQHHYYCASSKVFVSLAQKTAVS